ncbi:MAG: radical SAM family heme chaperone HemW [Nitrospirae bacterium]|nr:radical SAM family heme chaperone HemW [Nitrospirota bacterium]
MPASLYLHIPFCLKRCIYCDFVSGIYEAGKADEYISALKKEIITIPRDTSFSTLFIGGGTPTALSADVLRDLILHIFNYLSFTHNYEATIEANPGTLDKEKLTVIREAGMNRLSIGTQSLNDDELMLLGRLHNSSDAETAVHMAREAGFENIGIDLIYGIPGQSILSWRNTLEKAVKLKPEHISTYELTVEKGTVLYSRYQEGILKSLDDDLIVEMYNHTIDYLASEGYSHYEISNFAMHGYSCRHNLNYWDRGEYHGVGVGSHSFVNGNRFYNTGNLEDYLKDVSEERIPAAEREDITEEKALSEAVFLGLRKTEGINVESFFKRYGINILSQYQYELSDMQAKGLIEITNSECSYETNLRLTRRGLLLSNEVFVKFI